MKIISKRGKKLPPPPPPSAHRISDIEHSIIITSPGHMTAEEIKSAEAIFKEIRRQLEEIGNILTPLV